MRCYFVKDAKIVALEELSDLSCKEAAEKARILFLKNGSSFDGIEVWSHTRRVFQLGNTVDTLWAPPTLLPTSTIQAH